jgi:hypothetical protein
MATVGTGINVGDTVGVKYTPLNGEVLGAALDGTSVVYLVEYADNNGETQQRYFSADQLETLV